MSVEVGLPTTLVDQSCLLSPCRELNSLCRFDVFSRNLVIVLSRHRKAVLKELHETYPGMTQIKSLEKMFVWLPWIDGDIERTVWLGQEC